MSEKASTSSSCAKNESSSPLICNLLPDKPIYLLSTHGEKTYDQAEYKPGGMLFFGRETAGLGQDMLNSYPGRVYRVPMVKEARSLNLSNSVAIVLYEALRQNGFEGMG